MIFIYLKINRAAMFSHNQKNYLDCLWNIYGSLVQQGITVPEGCNLIFCTPFFKLKFFFNYWKINYPGQRPESTYFPAATRPAKTCFLATDADKF